MRKRTLLGGIGVAVVLAAGVYLIHSWYQTTDPDYRLRKGQEAARAGDYAEAERYARLLQGDDQADRALLLWGEIHLRQKDYGEALRMFNQIRDQGTIRLQAAAFSGECLIQLGEIREAERVLRFVVSEDPRHVIAHRFLAAIYYDQGDLSQALEHLHEVARLDPNDARPHRLLGLIHKDLDQTDEAIAAYEESLRRKPAGALESEVRVELAECKCKRGENERAVELVDGVDGVAATAVRVGALLNLDRRAEARPLLDEWLIRFPDHPSLLRLCAELHLAEKQPAEAVRLLEQALRLDPSDYRTRYQLALALERLGKPDEAQEHHRQVKAIQERLTRLSDLSKEAMGRPWDADVRLRLANLCDELKKPHLAAMWRNAAAACRARSPGS